MPALDGMRILDLTQYEAGPSATQALAWLGADVVKVERPGVGDPGRGGPVIPGSGYFMNWNANKRSLALDIASPEGRKMLEELIPRFDVFVENLGPGVIEKLDLGYEQVRSLHPSVIYASVKGFGIEGPYADYKCFDGVAMAMSGAFSLTGMPDGPPLPPGPTLGDSGTGMQLALAICAAYVQRLRTGEGQRIELSMQEAMTYYLRTRIGIGSSYGTKAAPRAGTGRGGLLNLYACDPGGANDYIYVMAVTEGMWRALAAAIGRPELLDDPRFASGGSRTKHGEDLQQIIGAWCSQRSKHDAFRTLAAAGVPCGAVLDTRELHEDPHLRERGFVTEIDHPDGSKVSMLGWPARMSASTVPMCAAPTLGAHSDEILGDELQLSADDLRALRDAGIVG
jgi:formyl-CoA transferase